MKREFKVGDKVYCKRFGRGKIVFIDDNKLIYTTKVFFKKAAFPQNYTEEGLYLFNEPNKKLDIRFTWLQRIINKLKK
jgi:hypothetical protein